MLQLVLTDRRGAPLGEVRQAVDRGIRRSLNRGRSARCTVRTSNPLHPQLLQGDKVLLKAYDDRAGPKQLRTFGPITGIEKTVGAQAKTLAVTSADPAWYLQRRFIGKSLAGASFGSAVSPVDRGEVMGDIIDALNAGDVAGAAGVWCAAGDTGIRRGAIDPSTASFFGPWRYYEASRAFTDLATGLDAPDWDLRPVEPIADALGVQIAALDVSPAFGQIRLDAAFELGTGRHNVTEYRDVLDANGVANAAINLPPGFPDNATQSVIEEIDQASIDDRGRRETIVAADLLVDDFRRRLVQEHIRIRKVPRRVIVFSPIADLDPTDLPLAERRIPRPFVDYDVGDIVPFRAVEPIDVVDDDGTVIGQEFVTTVDAFFRVFVIDISANDVGAETTTLAFVEEG